VAKRATGDDVTRNKTRLDLKNEMSQLGVPFADNQNYTLKHLQELAKEKESGLWVAW